MRATVLSSLLASSLVAAAADGSCPDYSDYSQHRHQPFSSGSHSLSYMRPAPGCRTFNSSEAEAVIDRMSSAIADPDLYRLFENAFPNTLDTAIKWRGVAANNSDEELTFVITGDINAMWLRDSANQMQSYLPLLRPNASRASIASLYRGVINLQTRYLLTSPYCNAFQAPVESGIAPAVNSAATHDAVAPAYSNVSVFECKYELDGLAAFLEISVDYYNATGDLDFFARFQWLPAVQSLLSVAKAMQQPTYGRDGRVLASPYTFTRQTDRATETLPNDGLGNPVGTGTGLIRSAFRPSDDATVFQLFIPANMMFARYLAAAADVASALGYRAPAGLAEEMRALAASVRTAIETYGIVSAAPTAAAPADGTGRRRGGEALSVYAYEVDGFGSALLMDDANIPSLLSAPLFGYVPASDPVYQRTRARILDARDGINGDSYYMRGPVINAVGGPHQGPGMAWPMASIVRVFTSEDEVEITTALGEIVSSTDGLGLIHESINTFNQSDWTRQWFSWANGLFGQMILDLENRKPHILKQSYQ